MILEANMSGGYRKNTRDPITIKLDILFNHLPQTVLDQNVCFNYPYITSYQNFYKQKKRYV